MGSIEGRGDLAVGRLDTDLIKPQKAQAFFTALSYNADGQFILAGGHSKTICIYHHMCQSGCGNPNYILSIFTL